MNKININEARYLYVMGFNDTIDWFNPTNEPMKFFLNMAWVHKINIVEHLLTIKDDEESDEYGNE